MELLTATLTVLTALHVVPGVDGLKVDVASHLKHLTTHRYPNEADTKARQQAQEYIIGRFEEYGLRVDLQELDAFAARDTSSPLSCPPDECSDKVKGLNIIGISGQAGQEAGAVVVVGAAYDTNGVERPLHDNGGGVAVLLETARLYQATAARPYLFTLFVAFDLSVNRYGKGGDGGGGLPGAWSLVQDYLRAFVGHNTSRMGGAVVLGPLMNVNHETVSQGFDSSLKKLFPAAHQDIAAHGHRGDFLAMLTKWTKEDEAAHILSRQMALSFTQAGGRLVELSLGNHSHTLLPPSLPPREAAFFWASTHEGQQSPLPAILLTDTESSRVWTPDAAHSTHLTEEQRAFLDTTVSSLVHFLVGRQSAEGDWQKAGLLTALLASFAVNLLLLVHLRRLFSSPGTGKAQMEPHCPSETLTLRDIKCAGNNITSPDSIQRL